VHAVQFTIANLHAGSLRGRLGRFASKIKKKLLYFSINFNILVLTFRNNSFTAFTFEFSGFT